MILDYETDYLLNLTLHNKVVTDIIVGETEWSPEELQHYNNNSKEVERAIRYYKKGVSVSTDGCVYQSRRLDFMLSCKNYLCPVDKSKKFRQTNVTSCLATALAYAFNFYEDIETIIAVVIADDDYYDVSVVCIGDGVIESRGIYGGKGVSLDMACDMACGMNGDSNVDKTFLIGNHSLEQSTQQIVFSHFGVSPHCFVIYYDLLLMASVIYENIFNGKIHNLLVLDIVSIPLGIRISSEINHKSEMLEIVSECTNIPMKKKLTFSTKDYPFPVKIEVLQGDFRRPSNLRLWELRITDSFTMGDMIGTATSSVELSMDIDCNGHYKLLSTAIS